MRADIGGHFATEFPIISLTSSVGVFFLVWISSLRKVSLLRPTTNAMKKLILVLILAISSIVASAQWYTKTNTIATATAELEGRGTEGTLPRPSYSVSSDCRVVVTIWVDNYGKVVKAQAGSFGTNTTDRGLWAAARNAALNTRFKQKMDAPPMQEGTIKYTFWAGNSEVSTPVNKGAIKFLGIPIDGSESQFAARLLDKGFTYSRVYECYKGQFNGQFVDVYLHTNHGVMDRVYVAFPYKSEGDVKVEFNNLIDQFEKSGKYLASGTNEAITDKEDISYEISVNSKRYQASFHYHDPDRDPVSFANSFMDSFSGFLTPEQLAMAKDYFSKILEAPEEEREAIMDQYAKDLEKMGIAQDKSAEADPEQLAHFLEAFMNGISSTADGTVWFMIHERNGKYQIGLYYDNLHNRPHGEDL